MVSPASGRLDRFLVALDQGGRSSSRRIVTGATERRCMCPGRRHLVKPEFEEKTTWPSIHYRSIFNRFLVPSTQGLLSNKRRLASTTLFED